MLVTLALLSLIVLSLMTVFNSTQKAFRASLTQTDILESGRLAMGLIADDLAKTTPSYGTNSLEKGSPGSAFDNRVIPPVNFYVDANPYTMNVNYQPFVQYLPGTSAQRTNVLETFFMLSRQNINGSPSWVGTGYAVDPSSRPTNSLYRFFQFTNVMKGNPWTLYTNFASIANNQLSYLYNPFTNSTLWTHVMDGVVDLTVRAYDPNGFWITNSVDRYHGQSITNQNTSFFTPSLWPPFFKVYGFRMYSNTVPATVEVQMGVLEDTTLQRAEGLNGAAQLNYLSNHVGQVHLFRQRVAIRNVDPAAYQ
jgi:hypothetical protein